MNICWDLLQATCSKGKQRGAHIQGNGTDGFKKKRQFDIPGQLQCLCEQKEMVLFKTYSREYCDDQLTSLYASQLFSAQYCLTKRQFKVIFSKNLLNKQK